MSLEWEVVKNYVRGRGCQEDNLKQNMTNKTCGWIIFLKSAGQISSYYIIYSSQNNHSVIYTVKVDKRRNRKNRVKQLVNQTKWLNLSLLISSFMKQKNIYLSCILLIYSIFDGADVFAERSVAEFYTNHEVSYHLYIDILSTKLLVFSFSSFYE